MRRVWFFATLSSVLMLMLSIGAVGQQAADGTGDLDFDGISCST